MADQILVKNQKKIKIKTPVGYSDFDGVTVSLNPQEVVLLEFDGNISTKCTPDHRFMVGGFWKCAKDLMVGDEVKTEYGTAKFLKREKQECKEYVYDIVNSGETNSYYESKLAEHNCLVLDEYGFVPNNIADEFYMSVFPTISSGRTTKVVIISTPHGMNQFYKIWTDANNHRNSFVPFEANWWDVPGRNEKWKKEMIANLGGSIDRWNAEFGNQFLGSSNTLISGEKLKNIAYIQPIYENHEGLAIYQKAIPGHTYVGTVDTSRGLGNDYHAFSIFDVSVMPFKIVARFRNNQLDPLEYSHVVATVAEQYNHAYLLVELNDCGRQVAVNIHDDIAYENLFSVSSKGKRGQTIDSGFGGSRSQFGLMTSHPVKRVACATLKNLIETDKLVIEDFEIMKELTTFVQERIGQFSAESGSNDDLVMTLVMFAWLTLQPVFKELCNKELQKKLQEQQLQRVDSEVIPFGIINDGRHDEIRAVNMGDGNLWFPVNPDDFDEGESSGDDGTWILA